MIWRAEENQKGFFSPATASVNIFSISSDPHRSLMVDP